ncbi:hypothetical protein Tco_1578428 [Tanacetum coccineum]
MLRRNQVSMLRRNADSDDSAFHNNNVTAKRSKWENDDYVCRGLILNGISHTLFDIYQFHGSTKELWDSLETKYMAEAASSLKFIISNFNNYKMVNSRLVMEQYNKLLRILGSHLRIEESLRAQKIDKPRNNNVAATSVVNMVEHNNSTRIRKNLVSSSVLNNLGYKQVIESDKFVLSKHARAFRAGTKPDFILRGTLHPTVKWAEEDNEVDPDELSRIKKSEMLQGFGADLIGSRNDGNKVHIKIKGIASLEDMNTVKSLLDSLSTPKRSALFGLPKFLLWCCLKCMFLYFPAMFFKGQMREGKRMQLEQGLDKDLVVDKDDDGSPSDDSGRDDSDGSASGGEQETILKKVSKKEAPPFKTSLSKKKNTNEGFSKKKKQKRKKDLNACKKSSFMFFSQLERENGCPMIGGGGGGGDGEGRLERFSRGCSQAKGSKVEERVFDGAIRGVGVEEVVVGEGVVVTSSSLEMLTNSCLGGIMVNLIFLEGFEEEALVKFMLEYG